VHDRRDGVEKSQRLLAGELRDRLRKGRRGEGAGCDDDIAAEKPSRSTASAPPAGT
jgi:hypothetical protein